MDITPVDRFRVLRFCRHKSKTYAHKLRPWVYGFPGDLYLQIAVSRIKNRKSYRIGIAENNAENAVRIRSKSNIFAAPQDIPSGRVIIYLEIDGGGCCDRNAARIGKAAFI